MCSYRPIFDESNIASVGNNNIDNFHIAPTYSPALYNTEGTGTDKIGHYIVTILLTNQTGGVRVLLVRAYNL